MPCSHIPHTQDFESRLDKHWEQIQCYCDFKADGDLYYCQSDVTESV